MAESSATPRRGGPVGRLSRNEAIAAYRQMLLIRRFEEKSGQLYGMGYVGGYCHLCVGQEAVYVGMRLAMQRGDQVISTYRCHGAMLAAGVEPHAAVVVAVVAAVAAARMVERRRS